MARIDLHNSRAWRARAAECRAIAEMFSSPETHARMMALADDYERRAEAADFLEMEPAVHDGAQVRSSAR